MRILVTGGAGFIGSNFIRRIADGTIKGISELTVIDNLTYAGNLENLRDVSETRYNFVKGDICDTNLVQKLVLEVDGIVNFAAESHVDNSITDPTVFTRSNVLGVQNILEAMRGNKDKILVQISTDEVYGSIARGSWTEESPLLPNSPYSASKSSAEMLIRAYVRTYGIDARVTRCSNNYGPFHHPEKLIPLFVTNLIRGKGVPVYGVGSNVRDWLHVDDHCEAIIRVLLNGHKGCIYNVGGGTEISNFEITKLILKYMKFDESRIEYVKDRPGHDFRYSLSWSKLQRELDYNPKINFEDGLKSTIDWYQQNESWWRPLVKG